MKKKDMILIAVLLLLSCMPAGYFLFEGTLSDSSQTYAVIHVNGDIYKTIPLGTHSGTTMFTVETDTGYNTILVSEQEIGIVQADCPDRICIGEGFISKPGQTVVCLPHKVLIEVKAANAAEPDTIPAR